MKSFFARLFLFAFIMTVVICCTFIVLGRAESVAKGATARTRYIYSEMNEQCLVLGSSRALHHYDPAVMAPVMGCSVYNCGEDRMGIIFNYGRLLLVKERYMPDVVVYDVEPDYDLLYGDNTVYLAQLRPYTWHEGISRLFADVDPSEKIKTLLLPYRLNNRVLQVAKDCTSGAETLYDGYSPYTGRMTALHKENLPQDHYDDTKWRYIEKIVKLCGRRTRLVFTASPQLSYGNDSVYAPLKEMCRRQGVPFLNHFCDTTFTNHHELFHNANHLERRGAEIYSKVIAREIKQALANSVPKTTNVPKAINVCGEIISDNNLQ